MNAFSAICVLIAVFVLGAISQIANPVANLDSWGLVIPLLAIIGVSTILITD